MGTNRLQTSAMLEDVTGEQNMVRPGMLVEESKIVLQPEDLTNKGLS